MLLHSVALLSLAAACDVTDYGAIGDGKTLNTKSIRRAIEACDQVAFPAGRWLTGTMRLRSNVEIQLQRGATILAAPAGNYEMAENPSPAALACAPGTPYAPECQETDGSMSENVVTMLSDPVAHILIRLNLLTPS